MKILLAIDQSSCSKAAVEAVKTRYRPADSEVLILHALDLLSPYAGMTALDPSTIEHLLEGERGAAEALVNRAEKELRAAGFRVSSALKDGDARTAILETASRWQADRVVVGSHGRGTMERLMLGSVSLAIARHAPCSVEIVRAARGK
jgi:nucleotide-binding universal stress UspA family protein